MSKVPNLPPEETLDDKTNGIGGKTKLNNELLSFTYVGTRGSVGQEVCPSFSMVEENIERFL